MPQTDRTTRLSFSLPAKNRADSKEQSLFRSALSLAPCRRSGCSPAVPYPPHECLEFSTFSFQPLPKGTFLLCQKGDISILG